MARISGEFRYDRRIRCDGEAVRFPRSRHRNYSFRGELHSGAFTRPARRFPLFLASGGCQHTGTLP
ncbi:MAG: hypothetical protein KDA85_13490, partial [Planctomycetaceae bacterium]|nr:hypothetical protein [Planctomycetaceae bacterium]